jgi:hypothetical protein
MAEELSIRYLKCPECCAVRQEDDWEEGKCPACGAVSEEAPTEIVAPFTKSDLDRLDEIKKKKSELEKEEKKLSPKIKDFLVSHGISDFPFEGHKMFISYQDRSTMNEEKLVELIKEVLTPEEIVERNALKEVSNPDAITKLVAEGRITMEQLSECKILNIVPVFNLNPKPKRKKSEAVDAFGGAL